MHQAVLARSLFESSQPEAEAEVEVWAGSELPGPLLRQLQSQIDQIQMQFQR